MRTGSVALDLTQIVGADFQHALFFDRQQWDLPGQGFSRTNLMYNRAVAEGWPDAQFIQQAVGQLPWDHKVLLLTKLKDPAQRLRYAEQAVADGWSPLCILARAH